jgi:hypothetical protein
MAEYPTHREGRLGAPGRILARSLESDPSDGILDLLDQEEILYGYNATAAARGRFHARSRLEDVYDKSFIYVRTESGRYRTAYHTIGGIIRDLGDDFIRVNHGLFVNHTKIRWLEPPGVGFQLAGFARREESKGRYDEWIVMSRIQGRAVYQLVQGAQVV